MNKKFWLGFIVVFVAAVILDYIVNYYLMMGIYEQTRNLWRLPEEMKTWVILVCQVFFAFFFTLIFMKWYAGKGIMEGLQYGLYTSLMINIPGAYMTYATMPVPYSLALGWFVYGTIEFVIYGVLLAAISGKREVTVTVKKVRDVEAVS